MKKRLSVILCMVLMLSLFCGCSAESNEQAYDSVTEDSFYLASTESFDYGLVDKSTSGAQPQEAPEAESAADSSQEYERKIIRNADLSMRAEDADACYDALLAALKESGGREVSVNRSSNDSGSYRYITISATFKLPPEKLDAFLETAGEAGEVTWSNVYSNEITEEYYDVKIRLEAKQKSLEQYYAILEGCETIDEILTVQKYINDLTEDIESLEGQLRLYNSLVDESTVELSITQKVNAPIAEDDFEWDSLGATDVLLLIKNGFLGVVNFLWSLLLWIIIIVISASPILLIVAGVIIAVRIYRKKHPKKEKPVRTVYMAPMPPVPPVPPAAPVTTNTDTGAKK